ncbi:DNA-3-methyladenine glycosylase II [Sphingomonas sp. SORGH_AS 950]|uniref:DNA-3-methyladenine glycosylase family protein n=1 Tax=unclassified Sphingomonas TaxID=196159 RepID=UPI0027865D53|nr:MULTISPECIES: DNA-3-methyladenine glycosylase 2 family protein [unclassified Sphingomonas]MDQ1157228.1 DNA-3-methyladenine glycosylase II [Sphingomonas sp. SORGH_AS_0950]MDR6114889.1 DNA-3-methyladenine glycosylase II [Sphingomonas sp. SORGH_AS_0789]MDR6151438.1 DNA-3-methyladenine glycosylase II [Sphingomonas sp. SORGH_AS_0742]
MGLSAEQIRESLDALAAAEPAIAAAVARIGYPEPRIRARGYATLVRTILGQQVSVASADAHWRRLHELLGDATDPTRMHGVTDEALRGAGISRQKAGYLRSLAEEVTSGRLDLANLPEDDEEAIAQLVAVKGIGRWSAEVYLLFAEGRTDIWPAGDLAVQIEMGRILGHDTRPSEKQVRALAEAFRPHRSALAIFTWHHYGAGADAAPV